MTARTVWLGYSFFKPTRNGWRLVWTEVHTSKAAALREFRKLWRDKKTADRIWRKRRDKDGWRILQVEIQIETEEARYCGDGVKK